MKTFYKLTGKAIDLMTRLDVALDTLAELDSTVDIETMSSMHKTLFAIFNQYHDQEFGDRDLTNLIYHGHDIIDLINNDFLITTYEEK